MTIIEKGGINEIYNIGTTNEYSVLQIAHMLISQLKGSHVDPRDYFEFVPDRFYNDFQYRIDCIKVMALGWEPRISFATGLRQTIEYYSENKQLFG
jgi:dTDP-D-glucose 4,6-dehydratase